MKLTLVHSSEISSKKIPWIYFGSSYLKMKKWENKIHGSKINIQEKIHNHGSLQKDFFLRWIENQRIANKDSIFWWMTQIAGRNNSYSNFLITVGRISLA